MAATAIGDVLLAVHGAGADGPTTGRAIADTLADVDRPLSDGRLLARLLELEASDHVHVERGVEHRFSLTLRGEEAAAELAGTRTVAMTLVMVDLVGLELLPVRGVPQPVTIRRLALR